MKLLTNSDPRITARKTSVWQYLTYVTTATTMSTSFLLINTTMIEKGIELVYIILAGLAFLLLSNVVLLYVVVYFRIRFFSKPMSRLTSAARKVAAGDFSVRIESTRKDGKKNEFDVLFDDFNTMVKELNSVEILKTDFISNVSHELKTPIAVIQSFASVLQNDGLTDEERKKYLTKISDESKRLTALITNILQLSKLENQKIHANLKPYNLSEQLCRCTLYYERILDERQIELSTDLDDTIVLNSDEQLLEIVWNNLLSNALKFTEPKGLIHVSAKTENGCAVVSVADNGRGMTEEVQRHIFEKFYQADASHTTKGNGLGLALVHKIIDILDGTIEINSEIGIGSRFTVKLQSKPAITE